MTSIRILLASASLSVVLGVSPALADSSKTVPPAKAVKAAESKLKALIKEGEDRPSVYEARLELVQALRALGTCDTQERMDRELQILSGWLGRSEVPVRLKPQIIHNELGLAAQISADCAEDESEQKARHEAALRAFTLAREAAKQNFDAMNEAVTLYNASRSAQSLGDLPRAIAFLEEACAIDLEYALYDNYAEDYAELVRMKDALAGAQTPSESVDQHLAAIARDKVRFSFKPVHGEQQRYRSETRQLTLANGQRQEQKLEMQYTGAVTIKDDLVTVTVQPGESKVNGRDAKLVAAESSSRTPEDLAAQLLGRPISYSVKTNGEFVGATGLDEIRRIVLAEIDKAFAAADASENRERARKLIDQVLSEAVINQQIASEWNTTVGWWIDAELDLGDWYALDVDAPQAVLEGGTLKYAYTFKVNRRVACEPADNKKSCVELILEGSPDREQYADYLVEMVNRLAGKQPRKQMRAFRERVAQDLHLVEHNLLVVEPTTLKTYKHLQTKTTYMPAAESNGQPKIELETMFSELQIPPPTTKPAPARPKPARGTTAKPAPAK